MSKSCHCPPQKDLQQSRQIVVIVIEILCCALQIAVEIMNLLVFVMSVALAALPVIVTHWYVHWLVVGGYWQPGMAGNGQRVFQNYVF